MTGRTPPPDSREWALRAYQDGVRVELIAQHLDRSISTIYKWLAAGEVPRRPPGPRPVKVIPDETVIEMRDERGMFWRDIGAALRLSTSGAQSRYRVAKARCEGNST